MSIQIDREDMLAVLDLVKPAVSTKETLEQATNFIFSNSEVLAFNGHILISYPFEVGPKFTVDANLFFKLVSRMTEETFNLELKDGKIKCWDKKTVAHIPVHEESEIYDYIRKVTGEIDDSKWSPLDEKFAEGLRLCAFSASTDESNPMMTCVRVEEENIMAGTGEKISWYIMDTPVSERFYLKAPHVMELARYQGLEEFCLSESWAHFRSEDGVTFSARRVLPVELLNFKRAFEGLTDGVRLKIPETLKESIATVNLVNEGKQGADELVSLVIDKDKIICKAGSEKGSILEEVPLENPIELSSPKSILIRTDFLADILGKTKYVMMYDGRLVFKRQGFQYVAALEEDA